MPPYMHIDHRLGGVARYRIIDGLEGALMNVPDEIRKCVAFVQYQSGSGIRTVGTAFFVGIEEGDLSRTYVITAKHVVEAIRAKAVDRETRFRMNTRDGQIAEVYVDVSKWVPHPTDPTTDLMVMEFPQGPEFDMKYIPIQRMAATAEIVKHLGIGIGDEIFMVGLFYRHFGTKKNIPIVRFGTIAAMPEEPVDVGGQQMDAYLVETRSIGGLSGSPVFTWLLPYTQRAELSMLRSSPIYLLGLMHGHWDLEKTLQDELTSDEAGSESLNTGIGVVVPVTKILEAINQESHVERRRQQFDEVRKKRAPTPDLPSP
jgi:hypothetical protein